MLRCVLDATCPYLWQPPSDANGDAPPKRPRPQSARTASAPRTQPGRSQGLPDDGALEDDTGGWVGRVGGVPSGAHAASGGGDAERQRAAFAAIERLRADQNAELRAAVESEQLQEAKRVELLAATPDGADRVRLQKLLKLERERGDNELMALTAEHELALAQLFKKAGVTR